MTVTLGALNSCRLIALIKTLQGANDVNQLQRVLCASMLMTLFTLMLLAKWLDEFKVYSN